MQGDDPVKRQQGSGHLQAKERGLKRYQPCDPQIWDFRRPDREGINVCWSGRQPAAFRQPELTKVGGGGVCVGGEAVRSSI